jgi:hypothetical protein
MRVLFLRKKLELLAEPEEVGEDITLYHGTNLANLYLIVKSGKLGSSVGFHTGGLRRVGRFYVAASKLIASSLFAFNYVKYMWPPTQPRKKADFGLLSKIRQLGEITYEKVSEATGISDVFDLYLTMWELAGGPENTIPDAAPVVLEITMDGSTFRENAYIDEDAFIWWVLWSADEETISRIVEIALQDDQFRSLAKRTTGKSDEEINAESGFKVLSDVIKTGEEGALREVYSALLRLLENSEWKEKITKILRPLASRVWDPQQGSFFFDRSLSFDEVKKLTAHVYPVWGGYEEIDLKGGDALNEVTELLKQGIVWYAEKIREADRRQWNETMDFSQ